MRGVCSRSLSRPVGLALFLALVVVTPHLLLYPSFFIVDDWTHVGFVEGLIVDDWRRPLDLFRFFDGDPHHIRALIDSGPYPWILHPELKAAFWRPLASALLVVDHALFGTAPFGYQLHSVLWYLALIAALGAMLRRILSPSSALVALLIFTVTGSNFEPVFWVSARHTVVSALFSLLSLGSYLRWRQRGQPLAAVASGALLLLALLAGETALGILAYLVGYELFLGEGPPRRRLAALLPSAALTVAWLVAYVGLGYGTHGSGAYLDPLADPLALLVALPGRLTAMLGALLLQLPAILWFWRPELRGAMSLVGAVALLLFFLLLRRVLRAMPERERRTTYWLAVGSIGSLLPQLAGQLGDRSLMLPAVGGAAVVAMVIVHGWRLARDVPRGVGRSLQVGCVVLVLLHLGLGPLRWLAGARTYAEMHAGFVRAIAEAELQPERFADQRVVLLTVPDAFTGIYSVNYRRLHRQPLPVAWWVLSLAHCDHRVRRTGPSRLELELVGGEMMHTAFERIYRAPTATFAVGDTVVLSGFTAEVLAVGRLGPTRVAFTFDRPLDDPSLYFVAWTAGRLRRIEVPPIGQVRQLPWSPGPATL